MESMIEGDDDDYKNAEDIFMEISDDMSSLNVDSICEDNDSSNNYESISTSFSHDTKHIDELKSKEEFTMPLIENGRFKNPWRSWSHHLKVGHLFRLVFSRDEAYIPGKIVSNNIFCCM